MQRGELTTFGPGKGLDTADIGCITEDSDGSLWIGTATGISHWVDGKFETHRFEGMAAVRAIHIAPDRALWIGTYGYNLFRFKNGSFVRITQEDGLFDDVVSNILPDDDGNLWMSGNKGIFRVARRNLDDFADGHASSVLSVAYDANDGMPVNETNGVWKPSAWKARDGKLWFAMMKGAVAIDPTVKGNLPPPVRIEQVLIDGRPQAEDQPVRILPGGKNLEIRYTAPSFRRPGHVRFQYKLSHLDGDWVDVGTRRAAYFPDLSPGAYRFTVIADNGEGVWNTTGASVDITVVAPYWRTWWFFSLAAMMLAAAAHRIYHLRIDSLRRAKAAQEEFSRKLLASQEAERQRIASELHDSLGQSLLIIKNRADLALTSVGEDDAAREQLNEISAAASSAVDEVREVAYNLRPYQLDRFGLTKTLNAICQQASSSCGIAFDVKLDPIDGMFPEEAEANLYRIVQEAISNIIRHSQATRAELTIRREGRELSLRIADNGQGFQSTAASGAVPSAGGFGLIGLAERVRMLNGTYRIETAPGKGVTIHIRLSVPGAAHE